MSSSSEPVRIGLIGCGRIAQLVHFDALERVAGLQLVAAAEPNAERRSEVTLRSAALRVVETHSELLELPEVEAVLISLPNNLHAEVACAALTAGKHVYLEKPLATNMKDGQRVVDLWRDAGRIGMIGFNYRFNSLHAELRQAITTAQYGAPLLIRSSFSSPKRELPPWKRERASGGGVLLDFASHHIDLLRFLTDQEVRSVSAEIKSLSTEEDTATLQLELESGTPVQSYFSTSATEQDRFEIQFEGVTLLLDRLGAKRLQFRPPTRESSRVARALGELSSITRLPGKLLAALASGWEPSFDACLEQFAGAIRGDREATPTLADGLRSLEVVDAAEKSARTGTRVLLDSAENG